MAQDPPSSAADWAAVRRRLADRPVDSLTAADLDELADACFWTDDVDASIEARHAAYRAHEAASDDDRAARSAWRLFYDHFLVGETAVAAGWAERSRRHVASAPEQPAAGWVALADVDLARLAGAPTDAAAHAARALDLAQRCGDRDLLAMALTASGRVHIAAGDTRRGLAQLDEAMVSVVNDELQPLYTGWVFCNVISTCYALADLQRANEWSAAALRWCAHLRTGRMYPGLCRVYAADLADLRGDWHTAQQHATDACRDLEAYDERYAGEAHYALGELRRRQGRPDDAERAFARAQALGREPQPGLALLMAERGESEVALRLVEAGLATADRLPLPQVMLLRAALDLALVLDDHERTQATAAAIDELASVHDGPIVRAHADAARALTADSETAVVETRRAIAAFDAAGVPYESARLWLHLADLHTRRREPDDAGMARSAADAILDELGAIVPRLAGASPAVLTGREVEVLALVAEGRTNPEIADVLCLSRHTVTRHLSNIMTKLGVTTRAAATAKALSEGLLR